MLHQVPSGADGGEERVEQPVGFGCVHNGAPNLKVPLRCHTLSAPDSAIVLLPSPAGVNVHPVFARFVIPIVGVISLAVLTSSPVRSTAYIVVKIVWLYFVTGSRG